MTSAQPAPTRRLLVTMQPTAAPERLLVTTYPAPLRRLVPRLGLQPMMNLLDIVSGSLPRHQRRARRPHQSLDICHTNQNHCCSNTDSLAKRPLASFDTWLLWPCPQSRLWRQHHKNAKSSVMHLAQHTKSLNL